MGNKKNGREKNGQSSGSRPSRTMGSLGEILMQAPGFDKLIATKPAKEPQYPSSTRSQNTSPGPAGPAAAEKRSEPRRKTKPKAGQKPKADPRAKPAPASFGRVAPSRLAPQGAIKTAAKKSPAPFKPVQGNPLVTRRPAALEEVKARLAGIRPGFQDKNAAICEPSVDRLVARGSVLFKATPNPAADGYIVGLDFGSSATKRVVHKPYLGQRNAYAILTPDGLRAASDPYCWQTAVWFNPKTQRFSLGPKPAHEKLTGFKSAIVLGKGGDTATTEVKPAVSYNEAAVAYLAMIIAHTLGDYDENRYFGHGSEPWFTAFFIGYPSTTDRKSNIEAAFAPILNAAFALVSDADRLTLGTVKSALSGLLVADTRFPSHETASPFYCRTELEGLIAGYNATDEAADGAHIFIDIGATTLDIAYLRFRVGEGISGSVYTSRVETLGAEALEWFRTSSEAAHDETFLRALSFVLSETAREAREQDSAFDRQIQRARGTNAAPVVRVLCGGGQHSQLHKSALERPDAETYWNASSRNPQPKLFSEGEPIGDAERLLVAWGLARDFAEFPRIEHLKRADEPKRRRKDISDNYIGPEQV